MWKEATRRRDIGMKVNATRMLGRLEQVNAIGALPGGGVCRLSLTDEDKAVRELLASWMREEGLEVRVDEMGNMYGIREGAADLPFVAIGSHLDTVSTGGCYDGAYGVMAGLEVISVLNENKVKTQRPLVLINFTNEEGARFAPDMMGSLVVSKPRLRDEVWKSSALDGSGATVLDELERIGYLGNVPCGSIPVDFYLELHIEQGPILEQEGCQIGIVEKVQGIYWTEYILSGQAAHAGTTPFANRRDPGILAARTLVHLREMAGSVEGQLGTIGLMEFTPNVVNVVPEKVRFITDLRNPNETRLIESQRRLDEFILAEAEKANIDIVRHERVRLAPVNFSADVVDIIQTSAAALGLTSRKMVSGAGHDAQMMAAVSQAAMIFVPSKDGLSHNVKEYTAPEDLSNGANVLLSATLGLLG